MCASAPKIFEKAKFHSNLDDCILLYICCTRAQLDFCHLNPADWFGLWLHTLITIFIHIRIYQVTIFLKTVHVVIPPSHFCAGRR